MGVQIEVFTDLSDDGNMGIPLQSEPQKGGGLSSSAFKTILGSSGVAIDSWCRNDASRFSPDGIRSYFGATTGAMSYA